MPDGRVPDGRLQPDQHSGAAPDAEPLGTLPVDAVAALADSGVKLGELPLETAVRAAAELTGHLRLLSSPDP